MATFNVKDFGAGLATGADDGALQGAFDAADDGDKIFFPDNNFNNNDYVVDGTLRLTKNVVLEAESPRTSLRKTSNGGTILEINLSGNASTMCFVDIRNLGFTSGTNQVVISITGSASSISQISNSRFLNAASGSLVATFHSGADVNMRLKNSVFSSGTTAIVLSGTTNFHNVSINDCTILGASVAGVRMDKIANTISSGNLSFGQNAIYDCAQGVILGSVTGSFNGNFIGGASPVVLSGSGLMSSGTYGVPVAIPVTAPIVNTAGTISISPATSGSAGSMSALDKSQLFDRFTQIVDTADFFAVGDYTASNSGGTLTIATGAPAGGGLVTSHPGIVRASVAALNDRCGFWALLTKGNSACVKLGDGTWRFLHIFTIDQLSTAAEEFISIIGVGDTTNGEPANGLYAMYDRAGTGASWTFKSAASSSRTVATGGAAFPTVDTNWHVFEVVCNAAYTSIEFFFDGVSMGTVTATLPTSANFFPHVFSMKKTVQTAAVAVTSRCDYMAYKFNPTTTRGY